VLLPLLDQCLPQRWHQHWPPPLPLLPLLLLPASLQLWLLPWQRQQLLPVLPWVL
jgi:hypothetical protein